MKKSIYLLLIAILLSTACKNNGIVSPLVGQWLLVERYYSIGGPLIYVKVKKEENKWVMFNENGTLRGNVYEDYMRYTINDGANLTITSNDTQLKPSILYYSFKNDTLILNGMCYEGCGSKFVKYK